MEKAFSTSIKGLELRLWRDVPVDSWLRQYGRTRVVVVDDVLSSRSQLLGVDEVSPPAPQEQQLRAWLNVDLQFFPMPADYRLGSDNPAPIGTFDEDWFGKGLERLMQDETPIAAILLDMMYGSNEHDISDCSGPHFLQMVREQLPDVPVLILSSLPNESRTWMKLKQSDGRGGSGTFVDYVVKTARGSSVGLCERIAHKLVEHANLTEPGICAFSAPMRRVARQLRQIVLRNDPMDYEVPGPDQYPKPVVLIGEYGSGKNYLCDQLRSMSTRQNTPYETITFSDLASDAAITALFGSGSYTNAPEWIYTDLRTGAVGQRVPAGPRSGPVQAGNVVLGAVGILQRCDMGDQPQNRRTAQPLLGTVVLDELGAAPEEMQTRLLGVLNRGQFTPHLSGQAIPTERRLNLWFLVPSTPMAFERMREDLRSRLTRGHLVRIPSLADREQDVLPLVLKQLGAMGKRPKEFFTSDAISVLTSLSKKLEVRDLGALLQKLPDICGVPFYNEADILKARDLTLRSVSEPPEPEPGSTVVYPRPRTGDLPRKFDKYILLEELGRGGMGVVYKAHDEKLDRDVALKVIIHGEFATDDEVKRLMHEARAQASLVVKGIVNVHVMGESDGKHFIEMMYVNGRTLDAEAFGRSMEHRECARIVMEAARAIHYAHQKGVIHRDLKPANILIDSDRQPWITDFGLAKRLDVHSASSDGRIAGTPHYFSPEQAEGREDIGKPADIYGLGAVLYRLLTWRPPFTAISIIEILRQVQTKAPTPPRHLDPSIPGELEAICLKCLEKEPRDRYISAADLATDLQQFLDGRPVSASIRSRSGSQVPLSASDIVRFLRSSIIAQFDGDPSAGSLDDVVAASTSLLFGYVDWAIGDVGQNPKDFSIVALYESLFNEKLDAQTCRTRLAKYLLFPSASQARTVIKHSNRLRSLADDVAKRVSAVRTLVEEEDKQG